MNTLTHPATPIHAAPATSVERHLATNLCGCAAIGACTALAYYALTTTLGFGGDLAYVFPSFYSLTRVFDVDAVYGFCVQCVFYGIIVGWFSYNARAKLGMAATLLLHMVSIVAFSMLA